MAERTRGSILGLAVSIAFAVFALLLMRNAVLARQTSPDQLARGQVPTGGSGAISPEQVAAARGDDVLIDAVLYDGYEFLDADEALQVRNGGAVTVSLDGWCVSDGSYQGCIPAGYQLAPGEGLWLAHDGTAFQRQFGFFPDLLVSPWPGFANAGDEVALLRPDGSVADVLVYKEGNVSYPGWVGDALQPYRISGLFAEEGQILYRRRDPRSGKPVTDTDSASDWAQATNDVLNGRRVRYPGWSLDAFFLPVTFSATGTITVAVAPDNAYDVLQRQIESARNSLYISSLTFRSIAIADDLAKAAERGVEVIVLLEGGPPGGIEDQERFACQRLAVAGGACWFMIQGEEADVYDRYRYLHAKYMLVDGERVLVASENLSPDSLPDDDKGDGTWGRRGVLLVTDAAHVVARLQAVWSDDFAPLAHQDLFPWTAADPIFGAPPPGFVPITTTGGTGYVLRVPEAIGFSGTFTMSVNQSPENSLNKGSGAGTLLALLARADEGDTVLVQQLEERWHWGTGASDPIADPNPRLEAYIDAARRGARVRLLLDDFFDDPSSGTSNAATCSYVRQLAEAEALNLRCARNNPTGLGLHNKMVLMQIDGLGWLYVGSTNGTELSHKGNREVALLVQNDGAYGLLAGLFEQDWPHRSYVPVVYEAYLGPAHHPLISEFLYDPAGLDDAEFIEIANPTPFPINIGQWMLGDATAVTDFEDMRRFPDGVVLAPESSLVVALSATGFYSKFGFWPDFEVLDSDPSVANLIDEPTWGDPDATLQLGNSGDEILLRRVDGTIVDAIAYGDGYVVGVSACALVTQAGHSLERYPYWRDTDDCASDFREWLLPNPGHLP